LPGKSGRERDCAEYSVGGVRKPGDGRRPETLENRFGVWALSTVFGICGRSQGNGASPDRAAAEFVTVQCGRGMRAVVCSAAGVAAGFVDAPVSVACDVAEGDFGAGAGFGVVVVGGAVTGVTNF